jgi:phosphate-selective porin OprO/OprP
MNSHGRLCKLPKTKKEENVKKKFAAAGAVLLATAFVGQAASAKTLEDILKEKGVITEADYKEITKVKPLDYKLGKGFTLTSADEKFQLSIGGQMQIRYTMYDQDRAGNPTSQTGAGDKSQFQLKRIKLNLNGYGFTKDLTYKITYSFHNNSLEETYLNYRLMDEVQFRLGQDKVQYGRQWITPSSQNEFVDTTHVTDAFKAGYDAGIAVLGKVANGLAYYQLGGYNGAGQNTLRNARDNAFCARITVNPLGDMPYGEGDVDNTQKPLASIGSSFYRNTLNSFEIAVPGATPTAQAGLSNLNFNSSTGWFGIRQTSAVNSVASGRQITGESALFNTAEVDAAFKWRGLFAQAEGFWAEAQGESTHKVAVATGYYVQAGYFIIPTHLEVAARYAYLDPDRNVSNDLWIETAGAVSYYFNKHNLKLQADVTSIHKQGRIISIPGAGATARPTDDLQGRVQAQLLF